ncbi:hypothetical protein PPYR_01200, partial [Photinus pyralis]
RKHYKSFGSMNKLYVRQIIRERTPEQIKLASNNHVYKKKDADRLLHSVSTDTSKETTNFVEDATLSTCSPHVTTSNQMLSSSILSNKLPLSQIHSSCTETVSTSHFQNSTMESTIPQPLHVSSHNSNNLLDTSSPKKCSLAKDLVNWAVAGHVSQKNFNNLLSILKKPHDINEFLSLPSDCRTLLKTHRKHTVTDCINGQYYHFGIVDSILYSLNSHKMCLSDDMSNNVLEVDINIDGLPLSKSSNNQFWPVLGCLTMLKCNSPFVIGVYCGRQKPSTPSELLDTLISEYSSIKTNGILFQNKIYFVRFAKFICDAPAKAFVLGVKGHNAYHSCTKCIVEGEFISNRMCFLDTNCSLRTDHEFRNNVYEDYHTGRTPLLSLDVNLVNQFPLDYMHLVCLGVMKKLLFFWIRGSINVRMNKTDLNIVDERLKMIRQHMSSNDFSRLPRTILEIERWKATEYRQFLLYTGPLVLHNQIKSSQFEHFLSLHCAMRILSTPSLCIQLNLYAKDLMIYFVRNFQKLYGCEYINHNVHNLIHLSDDVLLYGSVDQFSAFKYENYMSHIKTVLKTSKLPLQQFINREYEKRDHIISSKCQKSTIELKYDND